MNNEKINETFSVLWNDIVHSNTFPHKRPLLAHYTTISTLECVLRNDEAWFSNPLHMNDLEELRYGILEGARAFSESRELEDACGSNERHHILRSSFDEHLETFSNLHALDTYVFCLSEHDPADTDGRLSMWRGYGGSGHGAAIIFDSSKFEYVENSPLIISNVTYADHSSRQTWINYKVNELSNIIRNTKLTNEDLQLAAKLFFDRLKIFSLFTKHEGFSEEREWRIVYQRQMDINNFLVDMLDYAIGRNGVEPKLKFKIQPIEGITADNLSLELIVERIILGPSVSSPLAQASIKRMLERIGKNMMADRVYASSIPFRTT